MIEISDDIGQLFYQNICGKDVTKKDYLNIHEFLNKVSKSENEEKKPVLELIASSLEFIKKLQEKIFEDQKKEIKYKGLFSSKSNKFFNIVQILKEIFKFGNKF